MLKNSPENLCRAEAVRLTSEDPTVTLSGAFPREGLILLKNGILTSHAWILYPSVNYLFSFSILRRKLFAPQNDGEG